MRSERPTGAEPVGNLQYLRAGTNGLIALSYGRSQPVKHLRPVSRTVGDVLNWLLARFRHDLVGRMDLSGSGKRSRRLAAGFLFI
jgi:hypothetical protein